MKTLRVQYPEIKREFEALHLEDGSLIFNGYYGRQIHIGQPPKALRALLRLCDGKTSYIEVVEKLTLAFTDNEVTAADLAFKKLTSVGVITESLYSRRPDDIPLAMYERFKTEISAFQKDEKPGVTAFDYFRRLRHAKVTIIGAGGNGSLAAMMLAAAGVGRLHIVDGDTVSEGNLVRQIFYTEAEASQKTLKVDALRSRLRELSSYTEVTVDPSFVNGAEDVECNIQGSTIALLCADAPRFKINQWVQAAGSKTGVPYINVFAGLVGPLTVPGQTPCFDCLQQKYRKAVGPLHDEIVAGLQLERTVQYPSFVTGVVNLTYLLVREAVQFIIGTTQPLTFNGILRSVAGEYKFESFTGDERCSACQAHNEVRNVQAL